MAVAALARAQRRLESIFNTPSGTPGKLNPLLESEELNIDSHGSQDEKDQGSYGWKCRRTCLSGAVVRLDQKSFALSEATRESVSCYLKYHFIVHDAPP